MIWSYLPQTYAHADNLEARGQVHLASTLAGMSFSLGGLGIVHSLSHPMSARYGVPHGIANAVILPKVIAYNLPASTERYATIARMIDPSLHAVGLQQAGKSLIPLVEDLLQSIDIPKDFTHLDHNFTDGDIAQLAEDAMNDHGTIHYNPRKAVKEDMEAIYKEVLPVNVDQKVYH